MNHVLKLFKPEIEAKMKEERVAGRAEGRVEGRVETLEDLFRIVQKLRKGESVEQLMKSGMDIEAIKFVQRVLL